MTFSTTALWREASLIPAVLRSTLDSAAGFDETAGFLCAAADRRIIVTGNGAAYYAGMALGLAAMQSPDPCPEIVVVPAGVLNGPYFRWRGTETLLVISSSGELRDVVDLTTRRPELPVALITSSPQSRLARAAAVTSLVSIASQEALTHTQAYAANVAAALAVWARVTDDQALATALLGCPVACQRSNDAALDWAESVLPTVPDVSAGIVFGSDGAWAAAMEAALLLKEVSRVPVEGMETREGATTGMYALGPKHLVLSLPTRSDDALLSEAEETCRRTGATVLRAPTADLADGRLACLTTFAPALALAGVLGVRSGYDVDSPNWAAAYYATAR